MSKRGDLLDERQNAADRRRQAFEQQQATDDLLALLALPLGRRVLWRILDGRCGLHAASWTGNRATDYREGRRAVGIELMLECQDVAPQLFALMVAEAFTSRADQAVERKAAATPSSNPEQEQEADA